MVDHPPSTITAACARSWTRAYRQFGPRPPDSRRWPSIRRRPRRTPCLSSRPPAVSARLAHRWASERLRAHKARSTPHAVVTAADQRVTFQVAPGGRSSQGRGNATKDRSRHRHRGAAHWRQRASGCRRCWGWTRQQPRVSGTPAAAAAGWWMRQLAIPHRWIPRLVRGIQLSVRCTEAPSTDDR
jgi:hypothetical protein